jgi:hypothetical protein
MTDMKSLDEYEDIAIEMYGPTSHAVKWVQAQKVNKGTTDMSDESMMKMLERMDAKTSVKTAEKNTAQLPDSETEIKEQPRDQSAMKGLFAGLKNNRKT